MTSKRAVVITPSVGAKTLGECMDSVTNQSYDNLTHYVVVDGPEYYNNVFANAALDFQNSRAIICSVPENTGADGFYGHRIYAAFPHLVNADYIFFLDEDNWYERNHVSSVIERIERENLDFAYSMRNICRKDGSMAVRDDCESLGKWPVWPSLGQRSPSYLVDTSSYGFTASYIQTVCGLWHSGWGGDRRFFQLVRGTSRHNTTGLYTLNYRLDGNPGSVTEDFFKQGNEVYRAFHGDELPWQKTSS